MAIDPRRIWALGSVLAAGVLLVLLAAASWQEVAPRVNAAPQPGILIDIGGHRLHIHCQGSGSPTVVLEAGMSGWSVDWARVQPEVSRHTRTCAYDRAGYGWSDEAPGLRSSAQVAKELRALLAGSAIEEPIVLVGHSLGGLHAQMFARTYPASVAGLVLIDSVHRDQSDRMAATRGSYEDRLVRLTGVLSRLAPTGLLRLIDLPASVVAARLPASVRSQAVEFSFESKSYRTLAAEMRAFSRSQAEVAAAGPLPSAPHVALVSTELRDFPPGFDARMKKVWDTLQREQFAGAGADFVRIVPESGHYIHLDRPEVVIESILEVVKRSRQASR